MTPAARWAPRLATWRRRAPLWALQLALGLAMALLTCLWAGQAAGAQLRSALDARLRDAGAGANAGVVDLERQQMQLVRSVEFTVGLPGRLKSGDVAGLARLAGPLLANSAVPLLDVADADGTIVLALRAQTSPPPDSSRLTWTPVRQVLAGQRVQGDARINALVATAAGPLLVTAGPVREDGRIVGAAVAATPWRSILGQLANVTGTGLTLYAAGGAVLASSLNPPPPPLTRALAAATLAGSGAPAAREEGRGAARQRELLGRLVVEHDAVAVLGVALADRSAPAVRTLALETAGGLAATVLTLAALAARLAGVRG